MNSLVANYDSDSETDEEEIEDNELKSKDEVNFLTSFNTDNNSDHDDDSDTSDTDAYKDALNYLQMKQINPTKLPNPVAEALPSPTLDTKVKSTINKADQVRGSVFANQFKNAEKEKLSILEKHVKVTAIEKPNEIGGKKVCWNYRKGRCKKGHRCKFAHDNDIPTTSSEIKDSEGSASDLSDLRQSSGDQTKHFRFGDGYINQKHVPSVSDVPDDDSYMSSMKRKKRFGVGEGLVPPKKALNLLHEERATERPWTINKQGTS